MTRFNTNNNNTPNENEKVYTVTLFCKHSIIDQMRSDEIVETGMTYVDMTDDADRGRRHDLAKIDKASPVNMGFTIRGCNAALVKRITDAFEQQKSIYISPQENTSHLNVVDGSLSGFGVNMKEVYRLHVRIFPHRS